MSNEKERAAHLKSFEATVKQCVEIRKQHSEILTEHRHQAVLLQVIQRHRVLTRHFSSNDALEEYVQQHKAHELIRRRIHSEVKAKHLELKRIHNGRGNVYRGGEITQYWSLTDGNYVDVSTVFPEVPGYLNLCDYGKVIEWYYGKVGHLHDFNDEHYEAFIALQTQWAAKIAFLGNRWFAITGRELPIANMPKLEDLDQWKAPVPFRPYWSNALYSLEANKMGHPAALDISNDNSNGSNDTATNLQDEIVVPNDDAVEIASGGSSENAVDDLSTEIEVEEGIEKQDNNAGEISSLEKLYGQAGGNILSQPEPDEKLYTFPGTLHRHENIFYDYSLIIPVEECGPCSNQIEGTIARRLLAAKVLVGKAMTVLAFLSLFFALFQLNRETKSSRLHQGRVIRLGQTGEKAKT